MLIMMHSSKVFWDYFVVTGNIGAYLIFREIQQQTFATIKVKRRGYIQNEVEEV